MFNLVFDIMNICFPSQYISRLMNLYITYVIIKGSKILEWINLGVIFNAMQYLFYSRVTIHNIELERVNLN